jgi:hypothetical protein
MPSIEELITTYQNYSDEELLSVFRNIDSYSEEGKTALNIVIANKGGAENIEERVQDGLMINYEINRIRNEAILLKNKNADVFQIRQSINSKILPVNKVNEIIDNTFSYLEAEEEDKKIKPSTIAGSVVGVIFSSVIGGVLWGLQMIYTGRIFFILILGLALLC